MIYNISVVKYTTDLLYYELYTTISSKKYDNFVVLELEYIYLLYTTISSKKYDNFVVLELEYIYS